MRAVILDLDGTLADTSGDLIAAANACFERLGHVPPLDPVADMPVAFLGGRAMLRLGFERLQAYEADAVEAEFPRLLECYEAAIDVHTRLYPGAVEAVETLRGSGYALGVCTNKPEGLADLLLRRLGVRNLFGALIGADTLPVRKPDPLPYRTAVEQAGGIVTRSYMVGDTRTDRETARAAGVPCALVTFGPEGDRVAALQPEALLDGFDRLGEVTRRLIG